MGVHKIFIFFSILFSPAAFSGHYYKTSDYPKLTEAKAIALRSNDNIIDVCCFYPEEKNIEALKQAKIKEIKVRAGHFPSSLELKILEDLKIPYTLILSDVFPSDFEIASLNRSHISLLHILSSDFPTRGEVDAFNAFSVPVRFDILKMRLPSVLELEVMQSFKREMTVALYNNKVPGPGEAYFLNNLDTNKVFVVLEQFPWGIDPEGFALLARAKLEIDPSEVLMPQDVFTLNQFHVLPKINLREVGSLGSEWIADVRALRALQIVVQDQGQGELLSAVYSAAFEGAKSPVVFQFGQYH